jgi:hypothetical protein
MYCILKYLNFIGQSSRYYVKREGKKKIKEIKNKERKRKRFGFSC